VRRTRSAYRRAAELERATRATAPDRQAVAVTMPISDNVNDPEYWRKCAEDARTKAEETLDPKSKERLLRNAKEYDWLANLAESGDRSPAGASTPSASARDKQVMLSGAMGADIIGLILRLGRTRFGPYAGRGATAYAEMAHVAVSRRKAPAVSDESRA